MTRILRVKGAFLEMLRGKLEDSNFSISLGLCFFSWVYVSFLGVYMGFMYGFRAYCRLLKSRLNEMNDWRLNKGQIVSHDGLWVMVWRKEAKHMHTKARVTIGLIIDWIARIIETCRNQFVEHHQ